MARGLSYDIFFLTKTLILSVLSAHTVNFLNFLFGLRAQSVYFHIFSGHAPLHAHCFLGELEDIFNDEYVRSQGPRLSFVRGPVV